MMRLSDAIVVCALGAILFCCQTSKAHRGDQGVGGSLSGDICQGKPADVVFVMDSSGSIWNPDFNKQLAFVQDLVEIFDVSPEMTRIGGLSFSNWAYLDFHLNTFQTKEDILKYMGQIQQVRGDTNTAAAINYMRTISFTEANGARRGIPHIAIILTDGASNIPEDTAREAELARQQGIHIFAIGIGIQVVKEELQAIASHPSDGSSQYVFTVDSFNALQSIKNLLAIETCQVTDPPTTPAPPTEQVPFEQACGNTNIADIVFSLSPHATGEKTEKALAFYKEVASGLEVDEDRVRIGLVPKDCANIPEIGLEEFDEKDAIMEKLDEIENPQGSSGSVLRYMRRVSFNPSNGARPQSKKIGLVIVDQPIVNIKMAAREADKNRRVKDVELFVIGVGKDVKQDQLNAIASQPYERHVFHVSDYDDLIQIASLVRQAVCPVATV